MTNAIKATNYNSLESNNHKTQKNTAKAVLE